MRHTFLVVTVKRSLKSEYIYGSYRKIKTGTAFFGPPGISCQVIPVTVMSYDDYTRLFTQLLLVRHVNFLSCHYNVMMC